MTLDCQKRCFIPCILFCLSRGTAFVGQGIQMNKKSDENKMSNNYSHGCMAKIMTTDHQCDACKLILWADKACVWKSFTAWNGSLSSHSPLKSHTQKVNIKYTRLHRLISRFICGHKRLKKTFPAILHGSKPSCWSGGSGGWNGFTLQWGWKVA